mmetsp:Transcript_57369/g.167957  ORF Transcript_57369/g.167957 Transcript_57369/m.167957 type:complete len:277 (+) Transcript_57369:15-845(+)
MLQPTSPKENYQLRPDAGNSCSKSLPSACSTFAIRARLDRALAALQSLPLAVLYLVRAHLAVVHVLVPSQDFEKLSVGHQCDAALGPHLEVSSQSPRAALDAEAWLEGHAAALSLALLRRVHSLSSLQRQRPVVAAELPRQVPRDRAPRVHGLVGRPAPDLAGLGRDHGRGPAAHGARGLQGPQHRRCDHELWLKLSEDPVQRLCLAATSECEPRVKLIQEPVVHIVLGLAVANDMHKLLSCPGLAAALAMPRYEHDGVLDAKMRTHSHTHKGKGV